MKKKYIRPENKLVDMTAVVLQSASGNAPASALDPNRSVDADQLESRGSSFWDDEI